MAGRKATLLFRIVTGCGVFAESGTLCLRLVVIERLSSAEWNYVSQGVITSPKVRIATLIIFFP